MRTIELEEYQSTQDYFYFDDALLSIKEGLALFDFKIISYFIDLNTGQNNLKLISHHIEDAAELLSGLRLQKYIYNTYYWRIYNYTGYYTDEIFMDVLHRFVARPDNRNFRELMKDCCQAVIYEMQKDYAYQLAGLLPLFVKP